MHEAIAAKLRDKPSLLSVAESNLERWAAREGGLQPAQEEWLCLLESSSIEQSVELLVDPGERAMRLRQSSPFGGILSERERQEIMRRTEITSRIQAMGLA